MMKYIQQLSAYLPTIGILIVLFSLPYPYGGLQRFGMYLVCAGFMVDFLINRRWEGWHWRRENWLFVAFILFYLCIPVRQLFDPLHEWIYDVKIESYCPFLVIGIMGIMGFNHTLRLEHVAATMLLSNVVVAGMLAYTMRSVPLLPFADWQMMLNWQRSQTINSHMVLNLYGNLALVFGLWTLIRSSWRLWAKVLIGIAMVIAAISIILSYGRTGQITLFVLLLTGIMIVLYRSGLRKLIAPAVAAIALLGGLFWYFTPRYHEPSAHDNPRIYVWRVAGEMIRQKPVFGWGVSSARNEFIQTGLEDEGFREHYLAEYELDSHLRHGKVDYRQMHPHSAFIETQMELGIIGVLLLLLCFLLPLWLMPVGRNRWYMAACLFIVLMQALFDCLGPCLAPIWLPLIPCMFTYNTDTLRLSEFAPAASEFA